jgi:ATP10 protein
MRYAARIAFCLLLLPVAHATQSEDTQKAVVFPPILSYGLDKSKVNLPADFEGKTNLLLISFEPEQQKDVETWFPVAQAVQHTNFDFRWYRLPVSSRENFIFRWWENSSMRSDETDPETWHWIIPLYVSKEEFRRTLQIPNEHEIIALLTDKQGHVLWRASGDLTPQKRQSLLSAIAALAPGGSHHPPQPSGN